MADTPVLCPKCGMVPLEGCDGISGHLPAADGVSMRMCRNLFAKSMRMHLGKELSDVQHVSTSPLLERGTDGEILVDRTTDDLWIMGCTWIGIRPHLKLALFLKGLAFSFRIITDQQIKNVFVGNEHRQFRVAGQSFCNSLGDLVSDIDLVIVKLGYIGYKNKAASGALKETLLIREALSLPTWVIEDPSRPWTHSRDLDVESYLEGRFEVLPIESDCELVETEESFDDMGVDPDPDEEFVPEVKTPHEVGLDLPGDENDNRPQKQSPGYDELDLPGEDKEGWRR